VVDEYAARIKSLAEAELIYPPIDFEKAVAWCEGRTRKRLAPSQREALKTVLGNRVVVISGGPGVGKTTLVNSSRAAQPIHRRIPAAAASAVFLPADTWRKQMG
jgi:ATP-dependent exoDNAse (exonuclease V) alpha subunit